MSFCLNTKLFDVQDIVCMSWPSPDAGTFQNKPNLANDQYQPSITVRILIFANILALS